MAEKGPHEGNPRSSGGERPKLPGGLMPARPFVEARQDGVTKFLSDVFGLDKDLDRTFVTYEDPSAIIVFPADGGPPHITHGTDGGLIGEPKVSEDPDMTIGQREAGDSVRHLLPDKDESK